MIRTTYQLTLVGMGNYHFERKEYEAALEYYYEAPKVQAARPYVLEKIVMTMKEMGMVERLTPHLKRLVGLMPEREDLKVWWEELSGSSGGGGGGDGGSEE